MGMPGLVSQSKYRGVSLSPYGSPDVAKIHGPEHLPVDRHLKSQCRRKTRTEYTVDRVIPPLGGLGP